MVEAKRASLNDPEALEVLAHPVRLDILGFLMTSGPATASACARAVGDTASNCSYHLRKLAEHGLVEPDASSDGRERPWRATITGWYFDENAEPAAVEASTAAALQLDYQLAREHLRRHDDLPEEWRGVETHASYGLRVTPTELEGLLSQIDDILRPYIAPTRTDAPDGAAVAQVSLTAFPRPTFS